MEKEQMLTEMEAEKHSLVSQIQALKKAQVVEDHRTERSGERPKSTEEDWRLESRSHCSSPQNFQETMRKHGADGEEVNGKGAREPEGSEGKVDNEAALLFDLSCRSMAAPFDSPGAGNAHASEIMDGVGEEHSRDSLERIARTGMVDALFAASAKVSLPYDPTLSMQDVNLDCKRVREIDCVCVRAKSNDMHLTLHLFHQVEELETQLAASHTANIHLHFEIEALSSLVQKGLEGAGAGAGRDTDWGKHRTELSPAFKTLTDASRGKRVALPSDGAQESSAASNASPSAGVFTHADACVWVAVPERSGFRGGWGTGRKPWYTITKFEPSRVL